VANKAINKGVSQEGLFGFCIVLIVFVGRLADW
jgi:hypothetical protein